MAGELGILGFVSVLGELVAEIEKHKIEAIEEAAEIIEKEAKRVIGTYDYDWPELAESTQDTREFLGYTPNEPGLREGDMRDSITHVIVSSEEAQIGSDDDNLVYFEIGTSTQPPRPVVAGAAAAKGEEIAKNIGVKVIVGSFGDHALLEG